MRVRSNMTRGLKMPKYKLCPRCELNYIKEDEELCDVCKAQLNNSDIFEEEEEELCPICGQNFVEPGEKYCAECLEKRARKSSDDDSQEGPIIKLDSDEDVISLDDAIEEEEGDMEESFDDDNSGYQEDDIIDEVEDEEEALISKELEGELEEEEEEEEIEEYIDDEDDFDKEYKNIKIDPNDFLEDDEDDRCSPPILPCIDKANAHCNSEPLAVLTHTLITQKSLLFRRLFYW